jgi:hypothetical protein
MDLSANLETIVHTDGSKQVGVDFGGDLSQF